VRRFFGFAVRNTYSYGSTSVEVKPKMTMGTFSVDSNFPYPPGRIYDKCFGSE